MIVSGRLCKFDSQKELVKTMAEQLTSDEMKAFVRQHFEDFVNNKKAEVIRTNMTSDFRDHDGPGGKMVGIVEDEHMMRAMYDDGPGGKMVGIVEDEHMMRAMYEMMPDIHITIDDMVAEGDRVVCRNIWRWTDSKSGKRMAFRGFVEWRFEGGQIAERWATVTPAYESSE